MKRSTLVASAFDLLWKSYISPTAFWAKCGLEYLSIQAIQNTADFLKQTTIFKSCFASQCHLFKLYHGLVYRELMLKLSETLTFKLQREIYYSVFWFPQYVTNISSDSHAGFFYIMLLLFDWT